jgi:succinate dehydrogenase / fumarate reductase cytochrome b subunit
MNGYGERLHASGVLWPIRVLLLAATVLHVICAAITTARGRAARPIAYRAGLRSAASTIASRSMRVTGVLLLAYIVYHVPSAHGVGHPSFVPFDSHHNLLVLLHIPLHVACYVLASALIALHLAHGLSSAWISLGWTSPGREHVVRRTMRGWAATLTLGFTAIALAPWLGQS